MLQRYPQSILVSCEIPWDEHERLIEPIFRREIEQTLGRGFKNLYIFGTAGEGYAVDTQRFREIARIFHDETRGTDVRPMVGVIGLSTANVIERIAIAHANGFRTFQISLPGWSALKDAEIDRFFADVCGAFRDSQFLHYNLPRAKRLLIGRDYRRLADAHPNLVATKNTGGGLARASDVMTHAPDLQHFFSEENFPHGCQFGACSLLSSFGAITPAKTRALFEAGRAHDMAQLFKLQHEFHVMARDVLGPLLAEERVDGAYDKMLKRAGGLPDMPLRLLSPYEPFSEAQYQTFEQTLRTKYGDWLDA